jgi:hypothetical protein
LREIRFMVSPIEGAKDEEEEEEEAEESEKTLAWREKRWRRSVL